MGWLEGLLLGEDVVGGMGEVRRNNLREDRCALEIGYMYIHILETLSSLKNEVSPSQP